MPIQLNYTDANSGLNVSASYWTVAYANLDNNNNLAIITLSGHKDLAAKQAGKQPFFPVHFITITFAQMGLTGASTINQLLTAIYTFALANDSFFAGGTIV